jgi:hypothetical protein
VGVQAVKESAFGKMHLLSIAPAAEQFIHGNPAFLSHQDWGSNLEKNLSCLD